MQTKLLFQATALMFLVGLLAAACGDGEKEEVTLPTATSPAATAGAGTQVEVLLDEWSVLPNPSTVSAGEATFTAVNQGEEEHEMVIVKTDLAPDALPAVAGKVDEEAAGVLIGEIEKFAAGGEEQATFQLTPGSYVLFCNIVEQKDGEQESHYEKGMHVAFTVTE